MIEDTLKQVRDSLEKNTVLVGARGEELEINRRPIHHVVHYFVAPARGAYTAKELNEFMDYIFDGQKPASLRVIPFVNLTFYMRLGRLVINERVGGIKTKSVVTETITDPYVAQKLGSKMDEPNATESIDHDTSTVRIEIHPYPDASYARLALQDYIFQDRGDYTIQVPGVIEMEKLRQCRASQSGAVQPMQTLAGRVRSMFSRKIA